MTRIVHFSMLMVICICSCQQQKESESAGKGDDKMPITVTSPAFEEGGMISNQYTCDGADISPPLSWDGIPDGAKSLALISDDPDAPAGTWVHWLIFNMAPHMSGLPENVARDQQPAVGGVQGVNDFGRLGYGGPCPPGGTHRYYFKLFALDTMLDLSGQVTKDDLWRAMEGHVLGEGQLMARYRRQ